MELLVIVTPYLIVVQAMLLSFLQAFLSPWGIVLF